MVKLINNKFMIYEIIEKYWIDIQKQPIWEFLGISQVTWCIEKTNKMPKKHIDKIMTFLSLENTDEEIESHLAKHITKLYYN